MMNVSETTMFLSAYCRLYLSAIPCTDPPRPARSLRSIVYYFRKHWNIGHFRRRSLATHYDEYIWNSMLKAWCYRLVPLLFGENHILVIFAPNMHQKLCFGGLHMQKCSCPGRGDSGTPHLVASLPRSFPSRLLSEIWKYISRGSR